MAYETDEERKARLKKMLATTQLKLALETEEERRARLEHLSAIPIYIPKLIPYINCSILKGIIINRSSECQQPAWNSVLVHY